MSELSARRDRDGREPGTVACFCESCNRLLYVTLEEGLFCPVCSSAVTPVEAATSV